MVVGLEGWKMVLLCIIYRSSKYFFQLDWPEKYMSSDQSLNYAVHYFEVNYQFQNYVERWKRISIILFFNLQVTLASLVIFQYHSLMMYLEKLNYMLIFRVQKFLNQHRNSAKELTAQFTSIV